MISEKRDYLMQQIEQVKYMDRHLERMADVLHETGDLYAKGGDGDSVIDL